MTPLRGIALKLGSVFLFIVMAALIKATSQDVPPGEAVFFRSVFALPVILGWLAWRGELSTGLRAERPMGHVWRGVIGVSAMGCNFAALGMLPLPEVTAIGYAAPLMTVLLAALLLGERLRAVRMTAVGIGLCGVLIVLWPRLSVDAVDRVAAIGAALVLASAALRAMVQIHIRRLVQTESTSAIVFYFSLTSTGIALLTLPFGWTLPGPEAALMLVTAGVLGGIAQILLTSAYRGAEAALLAPFDYASMLFALIIGYSVFGEVPTGTMLLGAGIVMAAGGLIIWRERQLGIERGKARPGMTPHG
ncbi:DMT family transporter [Thalassococcus profundi]|uniref:DMT family transporter n=1 Tax=Thalassococcus profundi TaxID=2282382 RepID=A0A369TJ41_9RHOB|nr:DMT family transporter [Thalassococcus profundi]RDD64147.1 DMT family transporter [Thalassococcus profundi]